MKQRFTVTGMTCSACSAAVERAVSSLPGVRSVGVNLMAGSMLAEFDEKTVSAEKIVSAVEAAGYGASFGGQKKSLPEKDGALTGMRRRLTVSASFLIPLMYLSMGHMFGWPLPRFFCGAEASMTLAFTELLLTLPVVLANRAFYQKGFKTLLHGSPNMDTLVAVGSGAALLYGVISVYGIGISLGNGDLSAAEGFAMDLYFESAAMILTLVTLGKYFETKAKGKTSEAISQLMDLAPKTALVLRDGNPCEIPVEDVLVGDTVIVKSGAQIPVDGTVLSGSGSVDQSTLTGESIPVQVQPGDRVTAATVNRAGYFSFRADRIGEDMTIYQIVRLVEEASSSKAPISRLADRVASVFVPVVMTAALLAAMIWLFAGETVTFAVTIGIGVLVISCPCALGLATPVAIMVGTGQAARHGILIRSAEALETLQSVDTVVLDKTGTLTEGKPEVTDLLPAVGTEEQLLILAASLEQKSEHPLAAAILERAKGRKLLPTERFETVPGKGISAVISGVRCFGGSRSYLEEHGIPVPELSELPAEGKTVLYFGAAGYLGAVAVADVVRPDAAELVNALRDKKIRVCMLTGDNKRTANAIASRLGITEVLAEVLPEQKERKIAELQQTGRRVAMVGDGINDAPALVRADVGIAIGAGTDIAIESADIVLMRRTLTDIVSAIELSRAVIRNIRGNLFWAFFYNILGIPIAAGVLYPSFGIRLSPMIGAAAMSFSSVFVVTNALRLRNFKPSRCTEEITEESETITERGETEMETVLKIEGMMCVHCKARVEKALLAVPGTENVTVDLEAKTATVVGGASYETLAKAVADAGYEVVG